MMSESVQFCYHFSQCIKRNWSNAKRRASYGALEPLRVHQLWFLNKGPHEPLTKACRPRPYSSANSS
jgi:hypothetical protein